MYISDYDLLLGSQSPRRAQLLADLGFTFSVVSFSCEEIFPRELSGEKVAGYLSALKAETFKDFRPHQILLTADTVVCQKGKILGKPENEAHAFEMLKEIQSESHEVYTGISLRTAEGIQTLQDVARVTFRPMSDQELWFYIKTFRPMDKAGSYGIQEWIGMAGVERIEGSFYTIMGLPTHLVYQLLKPYFKINP